jgi:hypothetical protein
MRAARVWYPFEKVSNGGPGAARPFDRAVTRRDHKDGCVLIFRHQKQQLTPRKAKLLDW